LPDDNNVGAVAIVEVDVIGLTAVPDDMVTGAAEIVIGGRKVVPPDVNAEAVG